jgi:beta-glucosidase-like glycosyl hydrolase
MALLRLATAALTLTLAAALNCAVPLLTNVSLPGWELTYSLVNPGDVNSCAAACAANALCTAWTLYGGPAGRCFTSSAAGAPVPSPGSLACPSFSSSKGPIACPWGLTPCNVTGACALFGSHCALSPACPANAVICPDGTCIPPSPTTSNSAGVGFPYVQDGWARCPPASLPPYLSTSLSVPERVASIVSNLSLAEIAPQLVNPGYGSAFPSALSIPRLAIPPYSWLCEALHGFARSGLATSMPQISVIGNTFNRSAWWWAGRVVGLEGRAKHAMYRRNNDTSADYTGLTCYFPNINLGGRDARWGRLQETPTEDPYLMGEYGTAVPLGAQSGPAATTTAAAAAAAAQPPRWLVDPSYRGTPRARLESRGLPLTSQDVEAAVLATAAPPSATASAVYTSCKHAIAYSVEEFEGVPRAAFNAIVSGQDMLDTYMPQFQNCFLNGKGMSSMVSYNAVNGVPTAASFFLTNVSIRGRWGGEENGVFVVSDYGAVGDAYGSHHYCSTSDECVATCLKTGVDQDGGGTDYLNVPALVGEGLLDDATVRQAATRLFTARVSLGLLDPPEAQDHGPWGGLGATPYDIAGTLDSDAHRAISLDAATDGIVLLSNSAKALPLTRGKVRKVAVVGPNADVQDVLYGNYQGTPPYLITPRQGLANVLGPDNVYFAVGCLSGVSCTNTSGFSDAVAAASQPDADAVLCVLGIDQSVEAEGHDRVNITLPGLQIPFAQAVRAAAAARGVPFVVVYINGGPIAESWPLEVADAVVHLGYASQSAGDALARVLFGDVSPGGKLAVSWPASVEDLPPMGDMGMRPNATAGTKGRTYRFSTAAPLLPFGHGLTYTSWSFSALVLPPGPVLPCAGLPLSVTVTNTGAADSDQVVQVYLTWPGNSVAGAVPVAQRTLVEFDRVFVAAGASLVLNFTLPPRALAVPNATLAAPFAQDFGMPSPDTQARALSGALYGVGKDFHGEARELLARAAEGKGLPAHLAARAAGGPIGWDDMFFVPTGLGGIEIFVGSGQEGFAATVGVKGAVSTGGGPAGGGVNLAECDTQLYRDWAEGRV